MYRKEIPRAIRKKVEQARVARLATVDAKLRPHIVPVCFAYDGKVFYTAIDQKPKRVVPERLTRLRNILAVPEVALLIDQYEEDWQRLWWIRLRGRARVLDHGPEREHALSLLAEKYPQYADAPPDGPVLAIDIAQVRSWAAT